MKKIAIFYTVFFAASLALGFTSSVGIKLSKRIDVAVSDDRVDSPLIADNNNLESQPSNTSDKVGSLPLLEIKRLDKSNELGLSCNNCDINDTNATSQLTNSGELAANTEKLAQGPTIFLGYSDKSDDNPIFSFMYFVPMISPTKVEIQISPDSQQKGRIISYSAVEDAESFHVEVEMEMKGRGCYKNKFEPAENLLWQAKHKPGVKKLSKVLDYIQFQGESYGRIVIDGKIENGTKEVETVEVFFDGRNYESPVTVGLYDVRAVGGVFKYKNAENWIYARINSLKFAKTCDGQEPKMKIKLSSVFNGQGKEGFWGRLKGKIANLFIEKITITVSGNDAMMDFGQAVACKKPAFTFPVAANLKHSKSIEKYMTMNVVGNR